MNGPRRVVVAGAGGIAPQWLVPLSRRPGVELVGLVDPNRAAAAALVAELGLDVPLAATLGEALPGRPDLLVNLTPPKLHRAVSEQALSAGCDVLTEKPLASELEDAAALVALAAAEGRTLAVMQNRRYLEPVQRMRELVAAGTIGPLVHVCVDMFLWHRHGRGWLREAESPLLRDMAIHPFDAMRAVTGLEPETVQAVEWTTPAAWMEGADAAACTFTLSGGAVFSYRGSWVAEGLETTYDGVWRIGGAGGSIAWDGVRTLTVERVERRGPYDDAVLDRWTEVVAEPTDFGHTACLTAMLDALDRGVPPETAGEDNLKSLAMVFAAIRAAAEGRTVRVSDLRPYRDPAPG